MIPIQYFVDLLHYSQNNSKSLYDYIQLILPIISGFAIAIVGWIFAYKLNISGQGFQLEKEQYYRAKESMNKILTLSSELVIYTSEIFDKYFDKGKMRMNCTEPEIMQFNLEAKYKAEYLINLVKIEFPSKEYDSIEMLKEINTIHSLIMEINELCRRSEHIESGLDYDILHVRVDEIQNEYLASQHNLEKIFTKGGALIISDLKNEAMKLKIIKG
jgi:hypothetical protein